MINVVLNGEQQQLAAEQCLAELIVHWGFTEGPFAVAVNENFVARSEYANTVIANGDQVEIVSPIQGG